MSLPGTKGVVQSNPLGASTDNGKPDSKPWDVPTGMEPVARVSVVEDPDGCPQCDINPAAGPHPCPSRSHFKKLVLCNCCDACVTACGTPTQTGEQI